MAAIVGILRDGSWLTLERIRIVAVAVIALTVVVLGYLVATSSHAVDVAGRPLGTDFSSFYAAGRAVLDGRAADAYAPALHYAREQATFGADTPFYGWDYPPFFLLPLAPLALLPYPLALLVWLAGTLALYMFAIRAVVASIRPQALRGATWWLLAAGFPAVFVNLGHGQNGFLSAALIALALVNLDRRPVIAGLCFGLLACKPQLALMVPLVLIATWRWRVIAAAIVTVALLALVTTLVAGDGVWPAFLTSTAFARTELLEGGGPGWEKVQTVFAWVRLWGGTNAVAYVAEGAASLVIAVALIWLWRGPARFAWKAAALAIAVVAAAPFSIDYDMMVLAVAVAFLSADGLERGFAPWTKTTLAALWLVPLIARSAGAIHIPLGIVTMLAAFGFILWSARATRRPMHAADSFP
jgi:hypothetical protein